MSSAPSRSNADFLEKNRQEIAAMTAIKAITGNAIAARAGIVERTGDTHPP